MRPGKSAMALINRATLEIFQPLLDTFTRAPRHMILSSLDRLHVDDDLARDVHTEIGRTPRHMRGVGARHQGLGRRAAGIDASAAEQVALDHGDRSSVINKALCKRWACLAGSNDDRVIAVHCFPRRFGAHAELFAIPQPPRSPIEARAEPRLPVNRTRHPPGLGRTRAWALRSRPPNACGCWRD